MPHPKLDSRSLQNLWCQMVRLSFIWPRVRAAQLFTLPLSSLSMALHSNNYKES